MGHEKGLLMAGGNCTTHGPHFINGVPKTARVCLPDVNYHLFRNARVSVISSSVNI